ncbi:MAG: hypothetical protein MJ061_01455 [Mailhella sp.]|nr:hypothetical protein [Mailhella sp.]
MLELISRKSDELILLLSMKIGNGYSYDETKRILIAFLLAAACVMIYFLAKKMKNKRKSNPFHFTDFSRFDDMNGK